MNLFDLFENVDVPSWKQWRKYLDGNNMAPLGEAEEMFNIDFKNDEHYYRWLVNHFNKKSDPFIIFRTLATSQQYKTQEQLLNAVMLSNMSLGHHWSDVIINVGNRPAITIQAFVSKSSIDWKRTLDAQFFLPYEREFFVTGNVKIINIFPFDSKMQPENLSSYKPFPFDSRKRIRKVS